MQSHWSEAESLFSLRRLKGGGQICPFAEIRRFKQLNIELLNHILACIFSKRVKEMQVPHLASVYRPIGTCLYTDDT